MEIRQDDAKVEREAVENYENLQELGDYHLAAGDCLRAQRCYEKAALLGPDEAEPYVGLGEIALHNNLIDDAETAFRVACRLDNRCARGYAGLGVAAQQKGDYKSAFEMYLKCLELDTDNLAALLGLFQASCRMGSFSEIIHYLEVYLKMYPADSSVMFSLAALYVREGLLKQGREVLGEVLRLEPDNRDAEALLEEVEHSLANIAKKEVWLK